VNSVGFSLSRRDGDSNRLLPSWGQIPNHKPRLQSQCSHGSPLGLFGVRIAGVPGAASSGNQPKRQVAQAMLALGDQLRVPAHPSFLQEARQPGTCRPNPDLSASWFTTRRNLLSDRCFQLPTASRQGDQVLGGTGEMQSHPPGTLFILKPP
jgi:hypothetical protein